MSLCLTADLLPTVRERKVFDRKISDIMTVGAAAAWKSEGWHKRERQSERERVIQKVGAVTCNLWSCVQLQGKKKRKREGRLGTRERLPLHSHSPSSRFSGAQVPSLDARSRSSSSSPLVRDNNAISAF